MTPPSTYHYAMDDTEGVCDLYDDDQEDNDNGSPMPCV
jgi:hypothetical protein